MNKFRHVSMKSKTCNEFPHFNYQLWHKKERNKEIRVNWRQLLIKLTYPDVYRKGREITRWSCSCGDQGISRKKMVLLYFTSIIITIQQLRSPCFITSSTKITIEHIFGKNFDRPFLWILFYFIVLQIDDWNC